MTTLLLLIGLNLGGEPALDRHGDPLPDGTIARLGTVRFRDATVGGALAYTPDGTRLVTASRDGVSVWDARTGRRLSTVPRPEGSPAILEYHPVPPALAVSPDGRHLAHGLVPGKIHRVALADGTTDTLDLDGATATTLAFAPDGRSLVAVDRYHVRVVPIAGGPPTQVWPVPPDAARPGGGGRGPVFGPAALSPDGRVLAVVGGEVQNGRSGDPFTRPQRLHLWDVATGEELHRLDLPACQVAFHPDGTRLAAFDGDAVILLDATTGDRIDGFDASQGDFPGTFAFSPDGTRLTATGRLYDVATGEVLREVGRDAGLAFAPAGERLAVVEGDGTAVVVRDALTGRDAVPLEAHRAGLAVLHALPDGREVATAALDGTIRVWDARTGAPRRTMPYPAEARGLTLAGRWAAWLDAGHLEVGDLATGRVVHRHAVAAVAARLALAADGRTLLRYTSGEGAWVNVHDAATGRVRAKLDLDDALHALAVSPDGSAVATATHQGTIRLWDATTGRPRAELYAGGEAGKGARVALAFSPDGALLATTRGDDGELCLWDAATGRCVRRGLGHGRWPLGGGVIRIAALAFSADGRVVVGVGDGGGCRAWETASLRERGRWDEAGTYAVAVAGRHLLAATGQPTTAVVRDLAAVAALPGDAAALWDALASDQPAKAYRAGRALAATPDTAVAWLKERLRPVAAVDPGRLRAWVADLDAEAFETRERAADELARLGDGAVPALEAARRTAATPELKRRLDALLDDRLGPPHPDRLRALRAIEVLEDAATPAALAVLESLATGAPNAEETRQAKAALHRLETRP